MRAYIAVEDRLEELLDELSRAGAKVLDTQGRLVLTEAGPKRAAWASNVWLEPEKHRFSSIKEAARILGERGQRWQLLSQSHHRRGKLIEQLLPPVVHEPLRFGQRPPRLGLGSWTLLDEGTLALSRRCSSPFPNGEIQFVEDHDAPPSRAYLKLWEMFTLSGKKPTPGELCLDLGSSPGGWTWVLSNLGARVISVDKAPLAPSVLRLPRVRYVQSSAFALDPASHEPVDWLFSDVICYPDRLLECVERWLDAGKAKNLVCTLKFQGTTDHDVARRFARIPGSQLAHLHHNKHELTWWRFARA